MLKRANDGVFEPSLRELIEEADLLLAEIDCKLREALLQLERLSTHRDDHVQNVGNSRACILSSYRLLAKVNKQL